MSDRRGKHAEVEKIKKDLVNFARSSWGREWIHSILNIGRPYRMQRGINYAKDKGRIENISINKGQLFSMVQGTAPTPYRVKINFESIPEDGWQKILEELSSKTINLIELLNGVLPEDLIEIFETNEYPLFLDVVKDGLNATCSCPDQAVPCKHIAATILYVARVLDYNPFILLTLRGKEKNELLKDLRLGHTGEIITKEDKIKSEKEQIEFSFNIPKIKIQEIQEEKSLPGESPKINFQFKKPGKIIDTFENLGRPPNLEDPVAFEMVFENIYRTIINDTFRRATSPGDLKEKSKKFI